MVEERHLQKNKEGWVSGCVGPLYVEGAGQVLGKPGLTRGQTWGIIHHCYRSLEENILKRLSVSSRQQVARNSVLGVPSLCRKRLVNSKLK